VPEKDHETGEHGGQAKSRSQQFRTMLVQSSRLKPDAPFSALGVGRIDSQPKQGGSEELIMGERDADARRQTEEKG